MGVLKSKERFVWAAVHAVASEKPSDELEHHASESRFEVGPRSGAPGRFHKKNPIFSGDYAFHLHVIKIPQNTVKTRSVAGTFIFYRI